MILIRDSKNICIKNSCVTLGKFDGIHRGHRLLLTSMFEYKELTSVVFTFDFTKSSGFTQSPLIYSEKEKEILFRSINPDTVIFYPFTDKTAEMEAETFIKEILVGQLDVKQLVVGTDFRFGYHGAGDYHLLQKLKEKYGYQLKVIKKMKYKGTEISSSRIRKCIETGALKEACKMLGEPYFIYINKHIAGNQKFNFSVPEEKAILPEGEYPCSIEENKNGAFIRFINHTNAEEEIRVNAKLISDGSRNYRLNIQ